LDLARSGEGTFYRGYRIRYHETTEDWRFEQDDGYQYILSITKTDSVTSFVMHVEK